MWKGVKNRGPVFYTCITVLAQPVYTAKCTVYDAGTAGYTADGY